MKKKDQPLDLVVKKEEKAAGRFKRARGLKALASDKSEGCQHELIINTFEWNFHIKLPMKWKKPLRFPQK